MQKSHVWQYFVREGGRARCKVQGCNVLLGLKSTSSLSYHLEKTHKISKHTSSVSVSSTASSSMDKESVQTESQGRKENEKSQQNEMEEPKIKKQKTMLDFFSFKSLEEAVARLAAEDGLTIRQITRSSFIQHALAKEFTKRNIPKSEVGIMTLVEDFYTQTKHQLKEELLGLKAKDMKFSATLDEWTSMKNVRFMNINLHYAAGDNETKFVNLGMVKLVGSCPADRMLTLFGDRLRDYGIDIDSDIIAATGDGAALENMDENDVSNLDEPELNFKDEMARTIGNRWGKAKESESDKPSTSMNIIQKSFRAYEQHRKKSPLLSNLIFASCSVQPTSTQSERNFSLSGSFVTNLRTRLSPEHVDMLSFLKNFFLNQK